MPDVFHLLIHKYPALSLNMVANRTAQLGHRNKAKNPIPANSKQPLKQTDPKDCLLDLYERHRQSHDTWVV